MMFTSGTTGEPKGLSPQQRFCAIDAYTQKSNLTPTISAVPIYHITGLSALLAVYSALGASICSIGFQCPVGDHHQSEQNITFCTARHHFYPFLPVAASRAPAIPAIFRHSGTICGAGHLSDGLIGRVKN
ncbi:AMP-binding protein, partial [Klebsiella pneumoniae]|nr:AMP-binding protein [Klebsiella pneumoniae]